MTAEIAAVPRERWDTLLFVPADQPAMLRKAQGRGACALVIDLEDAIAPDQKETARQSLLAELAAGTLHGPSRIYVRINPPAEGGLEDAEALATAELAGLMVPKATVSQQLEDVREAVAPRTMPLIPQVESAAGVLGLRELLAANADLTAVAFGGEDFAADLGVSRTEQSVELLFPRAWLALCARAAGLPAIDTVYTDILDNPGLRREASLATQLGFAGKLLIHPNQVAPVQDVFVPSQDRLEWARRVLAAAADAAATGSGVATVDGAMVDAPVVAQAERILARGPHGSP